MAHTDGTIKNRCYVYCLPVKIPASHDHPMLLLHLSWCLGVPSFSCHNNVCNGTGYAFASLTNVLGGGTAKSIHDCRGLCQRPLGRCDALLFDEIKVCYFSILIPIFLCSICAPVIVFHRSSDKPQ